MFTVNLPLWKAQKYQKDGEYTGAALSIQFFKPEQSKYPVLLLEAVKQKSWDESSRTGSFYNGKDNPDKAIRVKLNKNEAGDILRCIRSYEYGLDAFHTFESDQTKIIFKPYRKKPKEGEAEGKKAFSITIKRGDRQIGMGIELGEAEVIKVILHEIIKEMVLAESVKG